MFSVSYSGTMKILYRQINYIVYPTYTVVEERVNLGHNLEKAGGEKGIDI